MSKDRTRTRKRRRRRRDAVEAFQPFLIDEFLRDHYARVLQRAIRRSGLLRNGFVLI